MRAVIAARAWVLLALGGCLAACTVSPPIRLYTLSPVGNQGAGANAPPAIRVVRVTLPGEIDRPELVQRIDSNRLQLAEDDRWAAPLYQLIQRTLSADLQSRVPAVANDPDQLSVEIEEFIGQTDCAVMLRAAWSLKPSNATAQPIRGYETIRVEPSGACQVSALPEAMSRALAELSNRVASARTK
ncbi:MAG: PqiC family protein [Gammaproteobacteria bacterium]